MLRHRGNSSSDRRGFSPLGVHKDRSLSVLTGMIYGIVNNVVACQNCPEYFNFMPPVDPQYAFMRPLKTIKPIPNAVVWGIFKTWHLAAIAGGIFALASRIPLGTSFKMTAKQLAPCMVIGSVFIFTIAHLKSKAEEYRLDLNNLQFHRPVVGYRTPKWDACEYRHETSYKWFRYGTVLLTTAILAARTLA